MLETAGWIFLVMLSMLRADNVTPSQLKAAQCSLASLSESIAVYATSPDEVLDLVALGFEESRFSYRGRLEVSHKGACGIFQQIPKYATPDFVAKPTCKELGNPWEATYRAVHQIRKLKRMFPLADRFCHYNSGMECRLSARAYVQRVRRYRKQARRLFFRLPYAYPLTPYLFSEMLQNDCAENDSTVQ